jgi:hypothetical protein
LEILDLVESGKAYCFECHEDTDMKFIPLTKATESGIFMVLENGFWGLCSKCHSTRAVTKSEGGWMALQELNNTYYFPKYCSKHEVSFFGMDGCPYCTGRGVS